MTSDIMWKSKSDANISLNFDASKFQTTIDFLNGAHISVIPIGSIVDAKIDFMFQ